MHLFYFINSWFLCPVIPKFASSSIYIYKIMLICYRFFADTSSFCGRPPDIEYATFVNLDSTSAQYSCLYGYESENGSRVKKCEKVMRGNIIIMSVFCGQLACFMWFLMHSDGEGGGPTREKTQRTICYWQDIDTRPCHTYLLLQKETNTFNNLTVPAISIKHFEQAMLFTHVRD